MPKFTPIGSLIFLISLLMMSSLPFLLDTDYANVVGFISFFGLIISGLFIKRL